MDTRPPLSARLVCAAGAVTLGPCCSSGARGRLCGRRELPCAMTRAVAASGVLFPLCSPDALQLRFGAQCADSVGIRRDEHFFLLVLLLF